MKKEIDIPLSAIIYFLYLNRPERCRKRRIRRTRSMVHARSSDAAPFVILSNILMDSNYLQYLNKITAPLVSRLIPVSDNGAFVLLSGFLFGFPIGSKNCAALLASGKNHTPGSRCFIYHYQQHQSGLCHKLHPLHPAWAVPSVGSYPADPVFSGASAGQYPALCRRTPHKDRTAFHAQNSRHLDLK